MKPEKIWLSAPHMGGSEMNYLQQALDSNRVAPAGPDLDLFEKSLEDYLGQGRVAVLNSGTAAIHLGLVLLGVQAGDEVLCQSMTFSASANPILYVGATPVFVDSETETWNLCPKALEEAIVDRIAKGKTPKAIIAVHLYGVPYQITAIHGIADKYGIPILEDSAEAMGSAYNGQKCGTFGDIGILSFNGSKIITTSGGGAIITPTEALKEKAVFLATQSKDPAPHYQHSEIGYNYRMPSVCAAIGRGQMEVLEEHLALRSAMHAFYKDLFKDIAGVTVFDVSEEGAECNYWLSTLLIRPEFSGGITREHLRLAFEAANIESRPLWKPMHLQPVFEHYPFYGGTVAETLFETGLCLPSGSNLSEADRDRIAEVVKGVFG